MCVFVRRGGGCEERRGGASGVAGSPPMDSHSPAEPRADGGERERVVHVACVGAARVCVFARVRAVGAGGLIDSLSDWGGGIAWGD